MMPGRKEHREGQGLTRGTEKLSASAIEHFFVGLLWFVLFQMLERLFLSAGQIWTHVADPKLQRFLFFLFAIFPPTYQLLMIWHFVEVSFCSFLWDVSHRWPGPLPLRHPFAKFIGSTPAPLGAVGWFQSDEVLLDILNKTDHQLVKLWSPSFFFDFSTH